MYKIILTTLLLIAGFLQPVIAASYKRIVSLAPSLTQSIYHLEADDLLQGCTSYCHAAQGHKPIVASAIKPNIETIVSLKPDLVITSGLTSTKDIETLRKFGIQVEVFSTPKSFEQICIQFKKLGTLLGKHEKAEQILKTAQTKIKELQEKITLRNAKVFIQIGASPIYAVIPGTFMDDYINMAAGNNIAEGLTSGTISRELVVSRKPDYIFIVTMGIVGKAESSEWSKFKSIPAIRNNKVLIINSDIACLPTPITFTQTLETIINYIQTK